MLLKIYLATIAVKSLSSFAVCEVIADLIIKKRSLKNLGMFLAKFSVTSGTKEEFHHLCFLSVVPQCIGIITVSLIRLPQ